MSQNVTNKIYQQLLKAAPIQAAASSMLWGEAAIPECMQKTAARKKHTPK